MDRAFFQGTNNARDASSVGNKELIMATIALNRPFSATALTEDQFDPQWEAPPASSAALTGPREQSFTFAAKANTYRVLLRDHVLPAWVKPTISGFIGVQSLADNWDSYGGKTVNRELGGFPDWKSTQLNS